MKNNQRKYIQYVKDYAETSGNHIWLGGSFLHGNPTPFSDVDISVWMEKEILIDFIFGYGKPIYISNTTNPEGIIIVIYEDGVAVDLEVIEYTEITDNNFFHLESIKNSLYRRNSNIYKEICQKKDEPYQIARLFHRSLIKYIAGKKEAGVSVANEIVEFLKYNSSITESNYKHGITNLIKFYCDRFTLDEEYRSLCFELINCIEG